MVEVLISIVILSFGLLGVAGLQAAALKYGRLARQQSTAVSLARELAEMMRANAQIASMASGNPYLGSFSGTALATEGTTTCLDIGSACTTPTEVAEAQMTDWLGRVGIALPGANVTICMDSAPYETGTGLPQWSCTTPSSASQNIAVIKLGWTQETTTNDIQNASDAGSRPFVVLPVTPGGQL